MNRGTQEISVTLITTSHNYHKPVAAEPETHIYVCDIHLETKSHATIFKYQTFF